jgi:2-succinyl-5-enolpyruvyl-6-hydroxy-3-cyclohexene-1-carboxylate synthase
MRKHYTDEINVQIIISLLKKNKIRRIVVSPGATNITFVGSLQSDPFFEIYSSVDERSAAYIACGLAAETGQPVVLSCTGATASRNYLPGLTEAFYRKLPVLAITSTQPIAKVGHLSPQLIDRSSMQNDVVRYSTVLPIVKDDDDAWECEIKVNKAISELFRHGGGPVHINLPTQFSKNFETRSLPECRCITRYADLYTMPNLPDKRIAIYIGSHKTFSKEETVLIERFCEMYDAVAFCDHTSGYYGNYKVNFSLVAAQEQFDCSEFIPGLIIHIGEVSGDYYSHRLLGSSVWRVSDDGEMRDTFKKLEKVFEMSEFAFFSYYTTKSETINTGYRYYNACMDQMKSTRSKLPDTPLSNIWIARQLSKKLPENSVIHFAILNSLRSWNFFELPSGVRTSSNVGGFGIDGAVSTLLGASLADKNKLYFGVVGDLAFFYDMNVLGNRHVGGNIRLLLINNGVGAEFKNYDHFAASFSDDADNYIAAAGHFGRKSTELVKQYAENLGFMYMSAHNKEEFNANCSSFICCEMMSKPIVFEVFTNSEDESNSLQMMRNIESSIGIMMKNKAKKMLGH